MSLVTLKEIMKDAHQKGYAVGSFNVVNLEMVRGIIAAAEREKAPVILEFAQVHFPLVPFETIVNIMVEAAKKAKTPVCVHFDHGDTFEAIVQGMKYGCTSVMVDRSNLEFEENIKQTKEIVKIAKVLGVSVEAELGALPAREGTEVIEGEAQIKAEDLYTDPQKAKAYVETTEIDALAIAYGTVHGIYLKKPVIDFNRLAEINKAANIPLVMHGGSGLNEAEYKKSIELGINKINYYSCLSNNVAIKIKAKLDEMQKLGKTYYYHDINQWAIEFVKDEVSSVMRIFNSSGKA